LRTTVYVIGSDGSPLGNNIPAEQRNQYWGRVQLCIPTGAAGCAIQLRARFI
jgi:hypothetical protein